MTVFVRSALHVLDSSELANFTLTRFLLAGSQRRLLQKACSTTPSGIYQCVPSGFTPDSAPNLKVCVNLCLGPPMPNGNKTVSPCVNCKDPGVVCRQVSSVSMAKDSAFYQVVPLKVPRFLHSRFVSLMTMGANRRIQNTEQLSHMPLLHEVQPNA